MATQVDFIGRGGSFKSFRPWRHRDQTAAGQAAGQRTELESTHDSAQETHGDDTAEAHSTDVNVSHVVRKERPPPAQRENHRPRALLSPSTSPSTSPSCPSQRISASHPAQADILLDDPAPPLFTASSAATDEDAIPRTPGPSIILSQEPEAETEPESEPEPDASLVSLSSEAEPSAKMPHASPPSPPRHAFPRPSLKRRRDLSDVDGPNTAALCCKKRRLRRFLITSRLSQPFSQPATHILNRESVAAGDKRFLKLAAIMNAKKLMAPAKTSLLSSSSSSSSSSTSSPTHTHAHAHAPMASEVIWRAAMANRLRQRLYAEATAASTAGRPLTGIPLSLMANMANARFTIVPVSTAAMAGRATTAATTTATTQRPATPASPRPPLSMYSEPPGAGSSAVFAPAAALSRSAPPLAAHRPIVRAVSRSPKLRPVKDPKRPGSRQETQPDNRHDSRQENHHHHHHHHTDDDSDCVFAFPANEHSNTTNGVVDDMDDDVADDGSEEIYADFSVLFSSATAGDELDDLDGLDGLDALDGLDDYMDELDGIAHLPR